MLTVIVFINVLLQLFENGVHFFSLCEALIVINCQKTVVAAKYNMHRKFTLFKQISKIAKKLVFCFSIFVLWTSMLLFLKNVGCVCSCAVQLD